MNVLPAHKKFSRKEAFYSLCLSPLEYLTKSLRMGDEWELRELEPFVRRCRALVSAFDDRMEIERQSKSDTETTNN